MTYNLGNGGQSPRGPTNFSQWLGNLGPNDQFGDNIILNASVNGGSCARPLTPHPPAASPFGIYPLARPGTPQRPPAFGATMFTPNGSYNSNSSKPPEQSTPKRVGENQTGSNDGSFQNASNIFGSTREPSIQHQIPFAPFRLADYVDGNPVQFSPERNPAPMQYSPQPSPGRMQFSPQRYPAPVEFSPRPSTELNMFSQYDADSSQEQNSTCSRSANASGAASGGYPSGNGGQGGIAGTSQASSSQRGGVCNCNRGPNGGCGSPVEMNNSSGSGPNRSSQYSGASARPQQTFGGNSGGTGPSQFSQPSSGSSARSPNLQSSANLGAGSLRPATPARDQQNSNMSGGVRSEDNSRSSPGSFPPPQNYGGSQNSSNSSAAQRPRTPSTPGGTFNSNTTGSGSNGSRAPAPNNLLSEPGANDSCGRGSRSPLAQPSTYTRRNRPPSCNVPICAEGCTCERAQRNVSGPVGFDGSNRQSWNASPGQELIGVAQIERYADPNSPQGSSAQGSPISPARYPPPFEFSPRPSPNLNMFSQHDADSSQEQNSTCNSSRLADLAFGGVNASGGEAFGVRPLSSQPSTQMDDIVRDGASFLMNVSGGSGQLNVPMGSPVAYPPDTSQIGNETLDNLRWGNFEDNILHQQNDSTATQEPMPPSPFFYQSPRPRNNNNYNGGGSPGGAAGGVLVPFGEPDTSNDSGYSARAWGPAPNPLVNAGNRMMGSSPGNHNRVFDTNKLKMWVLNAVGKACQGQCGKSPWECEEHILKFLMGVVSSWRNLYSRRNDGKFNFMNSNHFMNKNGIPAINDTSNDTSNSSAGGSSFCSRR